MNETTTRRRKTMREPVEAEVRLLDWAERGRVRAAWHGRTAQIDRGLPGELVVASIDRRRRGLVREVLDAAPERVVPPCPAYSRDCGGCQWQHVSYRAQVETKRVLVDQEMERAGAAARVVAAHPAASPWHYRRTAALALGWEAGFRRRGRRGIVEIRDCLIAHPLIARLADRLNDVLRSGVLPNYHGKVWLDCTVVGSAAQPSLQVVIQGIEGLTLEAHPELPEVAAVVAKLSAISSVAYRHRSGEPRPLVGTLTDTIEIAGRPMYLPAGSFCQTNLEMLAVVMRRMREELSRQKIGRAADIYGGIGTFGLALAESVEHMTLVELDHLAVEAASRTAAAWGLANVSFVSRHAERALPELPGLDLAIVDPPRAGLGNVVTAAIVSNRAPRIFYVSCAPSSLARDLAAFQQAGYQVRSLEIFDFYPQTYHVESLAILER